MEDLKLDRELEEAVYFLIMFLLSFIKEREFSHFALIINFFTIFYLDVMISLALISAKF